MFWRVRSTQVTWIQYYDIMLYGHYYIEVKMNLVEIIERNEKESKELMESIPYNLKFMFPSFCLEVAGDQLTFGEDYMSLETAREGITFLVKQLGGKAKWE